MWYRRAKNWRDFAHTACKVLNALDQVVSAGGGHERFTVFAKRDLDLSTVEEAFDFSIESLTASASATVDEELRDAIDFLEGAVVDVEPHGSHGALLTLVDSDGASAKVTVVPYQEGRRVSFEHFGFEAGDHDLYARFRTAFPRCDPVIYYGSGHTVTSGGVVAERFADVTFGQWRFDRFEGTDLTREKPYSEDGRPVQVLAGFDSSTTDQSLFGWALRHWCTGWLYCDDRSDEICDFVHLDDNVGEVRVVHIKAAGRATARQISAGQYEEVCAQVLKNLSSLTRTRLVDQLEDRFASDGRGPLWREGRPTDDYRGMIDELRAPRAREAYIATIVQPHVTDAMLAQARLAEKSRPAGRASILGSRLRRLEHLLVATDSAISRVAAHLEVFALEETPPL
jgi:hypothetical protein